MTANAQADRISYQSWQAIQAAIDTPIDRTPPYWKYVMSAYLYFRSRLAVPGRAYDSEEHGMLAIGGSAHADIMDLEAFLAAEDDETRREAYDWTLDSSQERVSYWRGMGRGNSRQAISRRRNDLANEMGSQLNGQKPV
jgi:hypothetical protein